MALSLNTKKLCQQIFQHLKYPMNLPVFIARKLVKGTPRKGRQASRTVITIAIGAIAVSMAVMIVAVAIVTGFQQSVRNKVIGFGSHIVVEPLSQSNSYEG